MMMMKCEALIYMMMMSVLIFVIYFTFSYLSYHQRLAVLLHPSWTPSAVGLCREQ